MLHRLLLTGWQVRQAEKDDMLRIGEITGEGWMDAGRGLQVQEALYGAGKLDPEVRVGKTESSGWLADKDWLYACAFAAQPPDKRAFLRFGGLDTVCRVFLNGEEIAFHDDVFLPLCVDVTDKLRAQNLLQVYFYSPTAVVRERLDALPEDVRAKMTNVSVLRKASLDFGDFGGVKLTTVGLFDDVTLETIDEGRLEWLDVRTRFNYALTRATVCLGAHALVLKPGLRVECQLADPDGDCVARAEADAGMDCERVDLELEVANPRLWYPKNYGEQPLYRLTERLVDADGNVVDQQERTLGLRLLEKTGDMRFRVNRVEVKFWGGNLAPLDGWTHRWDDERSAKLFDRLNLMNANLLRLWGGGMPYGDDFYERCDRAGIMVYQDFYLTWAYYTESEHDRQLYYEEALHTVRRLKHHPCILLWSGGNETLMHHEENAYEKPDMAYAPFMEDYARACAEADPDRFYLVGSPSGGDYPSDPSEGDGHPLYYTYRHSVEKYPVFVSESARTSTGPLRSLKRFMSEEEIWPEGYVNQVTYPSAHPNKEQYFRAEEKFFVPLWKRVPVPDTWKKWSASFFAGESAAVEKFYEAHDAESLVYRYNAAYADFMRTYSEGVRRGKPYFDPEARRVPTGYLLWKINDTWPQFYCSLIDYFMETYIPFYQVRRSYSPVLLSFEDDNHILLWGVNDTAREVRGTLRVVGFSMANNRVMGEFSVPVSIRPGESKVLTDMDPISPVIREWVLYASLTDEAGNEIARKDTFIELERYLTFPEARLTLAWEDGALTVRGDRFAHCVELGGGEDGQEFGWLFEDNYFNLLPFETKRVRVLARPTDGTVVRAKAHYSPYQTLCEVRA